jgi:hypothetical protein
MKRGQFRVRLRPLYDGHFTRVRLCGCVPTTVVPRQLQRLAAQLVLWSGWPVRLVLPAGVATAAWCELWVDSIKDIPDDHLEVRFALPRNRVRADSGGRHEP